MDFQEWVNKGLLLAAAKKYKEAVIAYLQAIQLEPNQSEAYFNLGDAYKESGDYEKAMEAYMTGTRLKHSLIQTSAQPDFAALTTQKPEVSAEPTSEEDLLNKSKAEDY